MHLILKNLPSSISGYVAPSGQLTALHAFNVLKETLSWHGKLCFVQVRYSIETHMSP